MTRVIVTGSRNWDCREIAHRAISRIIDRWGRDIAIVHGDAAGVDRAFRLAAMSHSVSHEPHPARWDDLDAPGAVIRRRRDGSEYNANAGPIRNQEMVDLGAKFAIAVSKDLANSKGTRDCVERLLRAGIPVYLIDREDGEPRRIREIPGRATEG